MLSPDDQRAALDLVVESIDRALRTGQRSLPDLDDLPAGLRQPGAAFVTLRRGGGDLRGCIGSLQAHEPLGLDIARHAVDAAFADPRFPPLAAHELPGLHVEVSVLTEPEPVPVASWSDLESRVRPGVDGLIVESGYHRGTFLPAVWESLPRPHDYLVALWRKAGLPPGSWPADLRISRYRADEFGGEARDHGPLATRST